MVSITRTLSLAAVLFVFWLLLSGHYSPYLLTVGLLSSLAVAAFGSILGYADREGHPIELVREPAPTSAILVRWIRSVTTKPRTTANRPTANASCTGGSRGSG